MVNKWRRAIVIPSRAAFQDMERLLRVKAKAVGDALKEYDTSWNLGDFFPNDPRYERLDAKAIPPMSKIGFKGVGVECPLLFHEQCGLVRTGWDCATALRSQELVLSGDGFPKMADGRYLRAELLDIISVEKRTTNEQEALLSAVNDICNDISDSGSLYSEVKRIILLGVGNYDDCILEAVKGKAAREFRDIILPRYI